MIPPTNSHITICFKNGITCDGVVLEWSKNHAILKSTAGASTIVINKMQEILFYKFNEAKSEYQTIKDRPAKSPEDIKRLSELKSELNELERKEISDKLKEHVASDSPREIGYGNPLQIPVASKHTGKEVKRTINTFDDELQNLFSKNKR